MDLIDIFLHDTTWGLVMEIIIRCCVMFLLILIFLKLSGKRGIRQLSIFEIAIILSLGSAAGDPMFIDDAPIAQAFVVMCTIIILYRLVTWAMMKSKKIEIFLEGKPLCIVENGLMVTQDMRKEKYSHDEFFAEMRQQSVEHLGQIKVALLETDGCLSILFYGKDETKWGLPIFPNHYKKSKNLDSDVFYSCMYCGMTQRLIHLDHECPRCKGKDWAESLNTAHIN
ncbi:MULTISPECIES: DUF421 domain-containing protein [unclassified Acinetobacter]|uniref:DUF421 domain-containing protein n=1 Tax=unclassified Acinetobacter TaxID=196816 RepID=UPI00190A3015|nr:MULTISPECIES: YetF domain-containing protein [unclassified Acinetobacter]MBK0062544.1 DUF421 domain-containing protein [Acinetobacter sp. S55]MBK0066348.1 DUF421 domain-containing protein [Acinetobacter sp. S54]